MRCGWLVLVAFGAAGCVRQAAETVGAEPIVAETIENVLTLQDGTISELKDRFGRGPFRIYALPPDEMLAVVERAARRARGAGGVPVPAVFVSERRGEVIAKERSGDDASDDGYSAPFRSAMVAYVHPVRGRPDASRVEIHAMERGPFHQGVVDWERSMPGWIDATLRETKVRPIPD